MSQKLDFQLTRDLSPSLPPPVINTPTAGYGLPLSKQVENTHQETIPQLNKLAAEVLANPMLQIMLSERIYTLMSEDLAYYKERARSYGGRN